MNVKRIPKILLFFFVKLGTRNDDETMMFLILTIFYNFHLKENDQNIKFDYTKNVKRQSIVKLIITHFLRKLDNEFNANSFKL